MNFSRACRGLSFAVLAVQGLATAADARASTDLVSASGAYLASRAAAYQGDMAARADFLSQALERLPGDVTLTRQTYKTMVSVGRIDEAAALARRLVEMNVVTELSPVTLLVDALAADDADAMDDALARLDFEGPLGTFAIIVRAWSTARGGDPARALEILDTSAPGSEPLVAYHAALLGDVAGETDAAETAYSEAMEAGDTVTWEATRAYGGFLSASGEARTLPVSTAGSWTSIRRVRGSMMHSHGLSLVGRHPNGPACPRRSPTPWRKPHGNCSANAGELWP